MDQIKYRSGFKYQLAEGYSLLIPALIGISIETEFISIGVDGRLYIKANYAWDGPSGPTVDTKSFMRGSLVHDALYQLIRMELLGKEWRKIADIELKRICREDGMGSIRAWYVYQSLRLAGGAAASPSNKKKVYSAP